MRYLLVLLLFIFAPLCWSEADIAGKNCTNKYGAKLISLQGKLLFDPDSKGHWQTAQLNETICEGSRLRVEPYSRVSLLLPDNVILRLDAGTVLSLNGIAPNEPTLLALLRGFVLFISRTPKHLEISSPIANAGPEGTEFAMSVDETNASLWVYEGGVRFFNAQGSINLKPGQSAQARMGQAPQAHIDIKPRDAVNWALYYPPLLPYFEASTSIDTDIHRAIRDFRHGRTYDALSRLNALAPEKRTPYFFKVRGAMRLTVGQVTLALQDIQALLATNPNDAEALALQSVLALTQNRKEEAYALANKAISSAPRSPTAYSALSYAEQSRFALNKALKAADQAVKYAPDDAMVWARKTELEFALGLTSESRQNAQRAFKLDDTLERTQTVMGFADLLRMDADEALQTFKKAVSLDSTSPLARLGLGLAKIRKGHLKEGRQDLEIAAILDPDNSLIRSYLGKAYYEERRSPLAEDQFSLAKQRDPKDPTPHFYDAINKQTINRPVEALHDMLKAIELNNNRAVYRSKLLLDEDAAARTANLARIYNDLGFGRVALKEAWNSLGYESTNSSAHRFLSDAYIGQPRYRVARASELLQAQLLQPINITPVQPQLTSENIGILNSTGPGSLSLYEYDPLFNANGANVVLNGAYGSNNTQTDNAIVSGVYNSFSASLGQFHYQTDGFRQNDNYQQNIYDAFTQYAFTPDLSVQAEFKSDDTNAGDVPLRLNGFHQKNLRQAIKQDIIRVGGHYRIDSTQNLIASAFYTTLKNLQSNSKPPFEGAETLQNTSVNTQESGYQTEMQYIFHPGSFDITAGFGYMNLKRNLISNLDTIGTFLGTRTDLCSLPPIVPGIPPLSSNPDICSTSVSKPNTDYVNGYVYSKQYLLPNLTSILGFSYDSYNDSFIKREQFNPKIGAIWNPLKNLTLRSAVFRSIKRPLTANQTIEPTQIAGFNQFYDGNNGTSAWQGGFGLDYNPVKSIYLGGEVAWRDGMQTLINNKANAVDQGRNEASHVAYLYWVPFEWMSFRSEYHYDKFSRGYTVGAGDPTNPQSIETQQIPLSLNFYHGSGFFAKLIETFVSQQVNMVTDPSSSFPLENFGTNFWTFDASLGYRLPKKIGIVSLEVRNLFDNKFNYQSTFDASGPQLTTFVPVRQLFAKLSLFY